MREQVPSGRKEGPSTREARLNFVRPSVVGIDLPARPLRIAIVAPVGRTVPFPGYAPLELVVDGLARGLHELGHEVRLFAAEDSTCPVPRHPGLGNASSEEIGSRTGELRYVLDAYEHLGGYDIIHDHTLIGPGLARAYPDRTVVTTNHGPWDRELTPIFRHLSAWVPIICVSHSQASQTDIPIAGVSHHGIDVGAVSLGLGNSGSLLFMGRMSPDKGPHIAAQVARRLGLPLVLAGRVTTPQEQEYFDSRVRPLLGGEVEFVGEASGCEKRELLSRSIALLNPVQWEEPFGLVMVEAMAAGTPVVAFDRGSVPEVVSHGVSGFVCRDEDSLVEALKAVGDLDRTAVRRWSLDRFSYRRMAESHVHLYRTILEKKQWAQSPAVRRSGQEWLSLAGPGSVEEGPLPS